MGYKFQAGGREIEVEEARMGQILGLRRFLAKIPRPEPPPLNLDGLMDGMTRGATEVLPAEFAEKLDRGAIEVHLREIRRMGRAVAEKLVKEIREEERYWPPDPQHPLGVHLLLNTDGGPEALLLQMLRTSDPGITEAEVSKLIDPPDPREGIAQADLEEALSEFFGMNRRMREYQEILDQAEAAERGEEPKGDPKADRPARGRKGRAAPSTTTNSTPS